MKLHLPVNLFRAVMALFATPLALTAAWAEESSEYLDVVELTEDTVHSAWNEPIYNGGMSWSTGFSFYVRSKDVDNPVDLTFTNAKYHAVYCFNTTTFEYLDSLSFSDITGETNFYGAAIRSLDCINIKNNNSVEFKNITLSGNSDARGAAMYTYSNNGSANIYIEENGQVAFINNKACSYSPGQAEGAAIRTDNLYIKGNGSLIVTGNATSIYTGGVIGGAMSAGGGDVEISGTTGEINVSQNTALSGSRGLIAGGAIFAANLIRLEDGIIGGSISIKENTCDTISFADNSAHSGVGAATTGDNGDVPVFATTGGALCSVKNIEICDNATSLISFSGNSVVSENYDFAGGGAIAAFGAVEICGNHPAVAVNELETPLQGVVFKNNKATSVGGAAYGGAIAASNVLFEQLGVSSAVADALLPNYVSLSGNGNVTFTGNSATSGVVDEKGEIITRGSSAMGGAIYSHGVVTMSANNAIAFDKNVATSVGSIARGGAVYSNQAISLTGNASVSFSENETYSVDSGADGGAIYSQNGGVIITGNGEVLFSANVSKADGYASGGAICSDNFDEQDATIKIADNKGAVKFENNNSLSQAKASRGGAIANYGTGVIISGNTYGLDNGAYAVEFTENWAMSWQNSEVVGGGIYSIGKTTITGNGNMLFRENMVLSFGGDVFGAAIGVDQGGLFIDDNLGGLTVTGNVVQAFGEFYNLDGSYRVYGANLVSGAVTSMTTISISRNAGDIVFSANLIDEVTSKLDDVLTGDGSSSDRMSLVAGGAIGAMENINLDNNQGSITFSGNTITATTKEVLGGAIASATGDISISNNSKDKTITFSDNTASSDRYSVKGGAIGTYAYDPSSGSTASVIINDNGAVEFCNNSVVSGKRDEDGNVVSIGDVAHGGAIYSAKDVELSRNDSVLFERNAATPSYRDAFGGAICARGKVTVNDNENGVGFIGNTINCVGSGDGFGGAIYAGQNSGSSYSENKFGYDVLLQGNGNVNFEGNKIESEFRARGGAIYADGYITLKGNADVTFSGNTVVSGQGGSAVGGAISTYLVKSSDNSESTYTTIPVGVTLSGNKNITFSGNSAKAVDYATAYGGAIHSAGKVDITGNSGNILFENNTSTAEAAYSSCGGAIAGMNGVNIIGNTGESIKFIDNVSRSDGGFSGAGAIYSFCGDINISDNVGVDVEFSGNKAEGIGKYTIIETDADGNETISDSGEIIIGGGALGTDASSVVIKNNGSVSFDGNAVIDRDGTKPIPSSKVDSVVTGAIISATGGGAVMAMQNVEINNNGDVSITGNKSVSESRESLGGAIASLGAVSLSHNTGDVTVSGNSASTGAGTALGGAIFAQSGLSVVNNSGDVNFKGNYINSAGAYRLNSVVVLGGTVELAAAEGKSIAFYDTIMVGAGDELKLNSYTDAAGNTQTSTGAIVFSGATTEADLAAAKGNGAAGTAAEIAASRTSIIGRDVSVAAGSLQVREQAVLNIYGSLAVDTGAELLLTGGSTIVATGDVEISEGAEYSVEAMATAATYSTRDAATSAPAMIDGNVEIAAGSTFTMDGTYTELVGDANSLTMNIGAGSTFNLNGATLQEGQTAYFVLFTGVDNFTLDGTEIASGAGLLMENFDAYCAYEDAQLYYINHATAGNVVYVKATIPEPTTATLSLLALAALAARRRRR